MGGINYYSKNKENTSISPGPGQYRASLQSYKSFSYSMGAKTDLNKKSTSNLPAPNHYNPSPLFKYEGHTKFGKDQRHGMINERQLSIVPGPFEYNPAQTFTRLQPPKYSFNGKSAQRPQTTESYIKSPGPGTYAFKSQVTGRQRGGVIGLKYILKKDQPGANNVPGPGAYNQDYSPIK